MMCPRTPICATATTPPTPSAVHLKKVIRLYGRFYGWFIILSDELDWSLLRNDFEKVVLSTYPEIMKIKNQLQDSGALFSSLSGSGSTMFGVYDSLESVTIARNQFKDFQTYIALPI